MSDQHLSKDLLDHGHRIAQLELKVAELERRLGQGEPTAGEGLTFASDAQAGGDLFDHPRMAELLRSGNKLEAIKLYREITGVGLKEAKDAVDACPDGGQNPRSGGVAGRDRARARRSVRR